MKAILRATAILSTGSMVAILTSLVTTKFYAVLLGPGGMGLLSLLQSLVGLTGLVAGVGVGAGLVCIGANALERKDQTRVAALRQAAWLLFWLFGCFTVMLLIVFRIPISRWMLGGPEYAGSVVLMGLALIFNLAAGIQTGLLNAHHRVGALARISVFSSLSGAGLNLFLVWLWRERGIPLAVIASTATGWVVSRYFLKREIERTSAQLTSRDVRESALSLLRFGLPYSASLLVGAGVQFALPALVLHQLGKENVGFYQAAVTVSVGYLSFLLTAMAQDYYPRISAVSDQPDTLSHLVNQQQRLVMILGTPMILGVIALARYLIPIVYSARFYPAVEVLEWQLTGDLLKLSNWTMGFVILARSRGLTWFGVELIGGLTTLLASWLGVRWFGLAGMGIGFLATSVVYYLAARLVVRREIGLVWTAENKRMMVIALLAALVIRVLPFTGMERLRTPIALAFAFIACLKSLSVLRSEFGGVRPAPVVQ